MDQACFTPNTDAKNKEENNNRPNNSKSLGLNKVNRGSLCATIKMCVAHWSDIRGLWKRHYLDLEMISMLVIVHFRSM